MSTARFMRHAGWSVLGAVLLLPGVVAAQDTEAAALAARMAALRQTSGFRLRGSLRVQTAGSAKTATRQVLIKGRQDGDTLQVLYQCLWPLDLKGQTLRIDRHADQSISGYSFEPPDRVAPLAAADLTQAILGSDLTVEDVCEDFVQWPVHALEGTTNLLAHPCRRLEFRPPPAAMTHYSVIQAWIASDAALPLLVEKLGPDGAVLQRTRVTKLTKTGTNTWAAVSAVTETPARHTETTFVATGGARDLKLPSEDFTLEGIKAALRAADAEDTPAPP